VRTGNKTGIMAYSVINRIFTALFPVCSLRQTRYLQNSATIKRIESQSDGKRADTF